MSSSAVGAAVAGYAGVMANEEPLTVHGGDLRELLDSDLPDPVLVLREGRVDVVAGADRAGLEVISRADLLRTTGQTEFTDDDLERQAAALTATTNNLGG
ncbi:hypothetical protein Actkin_03563 [Actinokineospora sp. UTMC 2448]|nr:hypothetical protein Actkin_03563 [Actinokineospora sp. UTMC 2448]